MHSGFSPNMNLTPFKFLQNDRIILHADFDSFFASCEQHFNPNLRNIPIGVTAANGRTCIIAASKEAKRYGIKTGTRTWEAEQMYPGIVFVKADFERYLDITKKFIAIASTYSTLVEVFSLDEVFIDLTPVANLYDSIDQVVYKLKKQIADEIGPAITISIGASYNKLLAKLASGLSKPDGYAVIDRQNINEVYKNTKLTDICGIGGRYKRRLNMLGIFTFEQLKNCPMHLLKAEFGRIASQNLKRIGFAYDDSPVISYLEEVDAKSIGRNYCLPENAHDQKKIKQIIFELCEEIAIKLRRIKKRCRTVGLYLSGEGAEGGRKTVNSYMNQGGEIFDVCMYLYKSWKWDSMVRQMGIWTSNLIDDSYATPSLFENPKIGPIVQAIDRINDRFGHHVIRRGFVLKAPKLKTEPNGFLGDRYIRKTLGYNNT